MQDKTVMSHLKTLFGPTSFLFLTTIIINAGNYGLNLLLARWLGPAGFAEANLLATLVMLMSFIAMGLQLTITKLSVEGQKGMVKHVAKQANISSWILVGLLLLYSPFIANFFNLEKPISIIILVLGIPAYIKLSITRGVYQGTDKFYSLGRTYFIEMTVRLFSTVLLLVFLKQLGLGSVAVSIGFLLSFIVATILHRLELEGREDHKEHPEGVKPVLTFLGMMMFYELSQILINNSDVILVMHYFDAHYAGLYASLAILGRAVFFATWSVVTVLFPKVIECEKSGGDSTQLFVSALGKVAGIGVVMVIGAWFFGPTVMSLAFGEAYLAVSEYLWLYALVTTLFACANVFVYYNLSLENYLPVFLSCLAGVLQVVLIYVWHNNFFQVICCQLAAISTLFVSLLVNQYLVSINTCTVQSALSFNS